MKITFLGHAGLHVETRHGSILCDPWFNPAYFASWFPFPSNDHLDPGRFRRPTFLYVSHLHHDHFDPGFLREHVDKDTTVLLPDYPLDLLESSLREVGFRHFVRTRNWQPVELDGLRITIASLVAPTDGPIGDSGLIVDDGETRLFDQNDSRPIEMERLAERGPFDVHFLQYSGAIWFPFVYQYPAQMLAALGRKKRENQMARALRYVREVGASWVVPSAGPPCLLDDDLFEHNDFDRDPTNSFPDQTVFLDYLREHGLDNGRLMLPGSELTLCPGRCDVRHPLPEHEIEAIFTDKRAYLTRYKARKQHLIDRARSALPRGDVDAVPALREWFEPLLERADVTAAGVNGSVVLDLGDEGVVIDFQRRRVERWEEQEWDYYFRFDRALVEHCIRNHLEDWINELFLSFRFQARRRGAYNEYVYNFFKCLTMERLQYAEGYYAEQAPEDQFWESHGYRIQRRCPHLKADLTRFAEIDDGVLTCTLHGWQFELATGRCLTSDDRRLYAQPLAEEAVPFTQAPPPPTGATVRSHCGHCTYEPRERRARQA